MKIRFHFKIAAFTIISFQLCLLQMSAENPGNEKPATTFNELLETELPYVVLTSKAEQRLVIETAPVKLEKRIRSKIYSGDLIFPLIGSKASDITRINPPQTRKEIVALIEQQLQSDALIRTAEVDYKASIIAFKRAENLLKVNTGSKREVDEAQARMEKAEANRISAHKKRAFLGPDLRNQLHSNRLWVRVPVYSGDTEILNTNGVARINLINSTDDKTQLSAKRISGFSTVGAESLILNLYYELNESNTELIAGQRVRVSLPLKENDEYRVIPWSAILYDIHGGTWVYQSYGNQKYVRTRVEVLFRENNIAVLSQGPEPSSQIVITGAAELFGTEFGIGK